MTHFNEFIAEKQSKGEYDYTVSEYIKWENKKYSEEAINLSKEIEEKFIKQLNRPIVI
jgi:hypothetical protein